MTYAIPIRLTAHLWVVRAERDMPTPQAESPLAATRISPCGKGRQNLPQWDDDAMRSRANFLF